VIGLKDPLPPGTVVAHETGGSDITEGDHPPPGIGRARGGVTFLAAIALLGRAAFDHTRHAEISGDCRSDAVVPGTHAAMAPRPQVCPRLTYFPGS
jgi:hypothetical protein